MEDIIQESKKILKQEGIKPSQELKDRVKNISEEDRLKLKEILKEYCQELRLEDRKRREEDIKSGKERPGRYPKLLSDDEFYNLLK
jgi:hypothetical protein